MIIQCPKCKNNFLAPDDLQEEQTLQCGNCDYTWIFQQDLKTIPEKIKPSEASHSEDFKEDVKKKTSAFTNLLLLIISLTIFYIASSIFSNDIVNKWSPSKKLFDLMNIETTLDKKPSLIIKDVKALKTGNEIIISGSIKNLKANETIVPTIKVNDKFDVYPKQRKLSSQKETSFEANLPMDIKEPMKISF
ncbi:MAG: zinc-ribbon domain-containing protein [Alphaproteobacteria bacterium]|jgi:DNA-directed RNA polymerase subunit RPC12/RpoP|nr:zinc-ribbon domain-containing protein [Alphaproteobacteria bacterium]